MGDNAITDISQTGVLLYILSSLVSLIHSDYTMIYFDRPWAGCNNSTEQMSTRR